MRERGHGLDCIPAMTYPLPPSFDHLKLGHGNRALALKALEVRLEAKEANAVR
jgi:hypothetical protein